ncbi:hypothetical protein NDU88_003149 [Pleurodeles waltl]|uniref:Uncharacterized protein n=1 Tax=Pleurodeles waltl TaxID=8319 RepID=A0AAV7KVQ1_PLEWA|nr:hypothetical protein NDU88_003149 [Pleurodeles waltl]
MVTLAETRCGDYWAHAVVVPGSDWGRDRPSAPKELSEGAQIREEQSSVLSTSRFCTETLFIWQQLQILVRVLSQKVSRGINTVNSLAQFLKTYYGRTPNSSIQSTMKCLLEPILMDVFK